MHAATAGVAILCSTTDMAKVLVTAQWQSKMSELVKFTTRTMRRAYDLQEIGKCYFVNTILLYVYLVNRV